MRGITIAEPFALALTRRDNWTVSSPATLANVRGHGRTNQESDMPIVTPPPTFCESPARTNSEVCC